MSAETFRPTDEQKDVIEHDGSAFVRACPGAGKTRVMVERARRLFADETVTRGVAFLSFTRGAISELEARLQQEGLLPAPAFPNFIGTFDSFVWQFFIAPLGIKGINARPQLLEDLDKIKIAPPGWELSFSLGCFCPESNELLLEDARKEARHADRLSDAQKRQYKAAAIKARAGLLKHGHLNFDEARRVALEWMQDDDVSRRMAEALRGRFHEVIIDEAQDCNPGDLDIVNWLRQSGLPTKVVCDPEQAIYSFRGGVTDELNKFEKTFGDDERKSLTGNFRSAPNICRAISGFRSQAPNEKPDRPLGGHKDDVTPVRVLAYEGKGVPNSIGASFRQCLDDEGIDIEKCPVLAATRDSAAKAVGGLVQSDSEAPAVCLAQAVMRFHFSSSFGETKAAMQQAHRTLLRVEKRLDDVTYRQYVAESDPELGDWRPRVLHILRELRFDPAKHGNADGWHKAAKSLLSDHVKLPAERTIDQQFKRNDLVAGALAVPPDGTAMPCTIHSVKGMEFPAVCVVTTKTLKGILDYLETGEAGDRAEDARILYVAASRAERLLVIAAPKNQAERLAEHLRGKGAAVEVRDI